MTEQSPSPQSIIGNYNAQVRGDGTATVNIYQSIMPRPVDADTLAVAQAQRSTIPLDHVPPIAPLTPSSVMPFRANPAFVGRQDTLRQVAQHLRDTTTLGSALALTGMGGMGKTQLASEIVHRYGPFFAGGVFWLACADPAIVPGEIAACGARGLVDWRPDYLSLSQEEQVQLVLSAWQSPLPRLLIFDNCEDPALLTKWRPTTGGCVVLVTSRRTSWPSTMGVIVYALEMLRRSESIALLRQFCPDPAVDESDLAALAEEMGDLPLALHLAGRYLEVMRHTVTPMDYLAKVQTPDLLVHPSLQGWESVTNDSPTQHIQDIARTFAISYDLLEATAPCGVHARWTLACVAACAPSNIVPRAVIHAVLEAEAESLDYHTKEAILMRLTNHGLLSQEAHGAVRMHRLIMRFVQRQPIMQETRPAPIPESEQHYLPRWLRRWQLSTPRPRTVEETVAQALVHVAQQAEKQDVSVRLIELHPHLRHSSMVLLRQADLRAATLGDLIGYYLCQLFDYTTARPLLEHAKTIREDTLGPNHPDLAKSLEHLAELHLAEGNDVAARACYERALAIREQIPGPHHPAMAISLTALAHQYCKQHDYVMARTCYERALAIREEVLEPDHPAVAESLANLAHLLYVQREYHDAYLLYERALVIREEVLGSDHPDTAQNLNNMAYLLDRQGDYAAARPLYERALSINEQHLGPDHPHAVRVRNNLAVCVDALSKRPPDPES